MRAEFLRGAAAGGGGGHPGGEAGGGCASAGLVVGRGPQPIGGPAAAVMESAVRGAGKGAELIDLTTQQGVHPRIGAADVIPFVPIRGISLEQCALLARQAGREIWSRYQVPVYFYEAAAAR